MLPKTETVGRSPQPLNDFPLHFFSHTSRKVFRTVKVKFFFTYTYCFLRVNFLRDVWILSLVFCKAISVARIPRNVHYLFTITQYAQHSFVRWFNGNVWRARRFFCVSNIFYKRHLGWYWLGLLKRELSPWPTISRDIDKVGHPGPWNLSKPLENL